MGSPVRRTAAGLIALLLPASAAATPVPGGSHLAWLHADNAWTVAAEPVQATADDVADIAKISGARTAPYLFCGSNPFAFAHLGVDKLTMPTASIEVLDGVTGDPVWEVDLNPDDVGAVLVEQLVAGDLYGDGGSELVVVWSEFFDSTVDAHLEIRDAATGAVLYERVSTNKRQEALLTRVEPISVLGEPGLFISEQRLVLSGDMPPVISFKGGGVFAQLSRGAEPAVVATVPADLPMPTVTPVADGFRIVAMRLAVTPPPNLDIRADLRVVDLKFDDEGNARFETVWERAGAGGNPVVVTGGADPAILVGIADDNEVGSISAFDLDDGEPRWTAPVDVSPFGGTFMSRDLDGDGVEELVAAPRFSEDPTGLFLGGFHADILGLDPEDGSLDWAHSERAGKILPWALDAADLDADGTAEILATFSHQDGFPLCANAADDAGLIGVYDVSGEARCRFSTDRVALDLAVADVDGAPGDEVVAPTLGGNVYAFRNAEPGCGVLASS